MVVRTKAALAQEIADMIDSGGTPRIAALDVRRILGDFLDSLAFLTDVPTLRTEQQIVHAINEALGGNTWQEGSAQGGGITLNAALNAIVIDDTPVNGVEMYVDRSAAGHITIGLQEQVIEHVSLLGVKATQDFVAADFTVEGDVGEVALTVPGAPAWPDGARRYVAYARPESQGDFTYVYYYVAGAPNQNSQFGAWEQLADTIVLDNEEHNILVSRGALRDTARGRVVEAG